jgi:hypothetical protein
MAAWMRMTAFASACAVVACGCGSSVPSDLDLSTTGHVEQAAIGVASVEVIPKPAGVEYFAGQIAIEGDTLLATAAPSDEPWVDRLLYVYRRTNGLWAQTGVVETGAPGNPSTNPRLILHGETALLGAAAWDPAVRLGRVIVLARQDDSFAVVGEIGDPDVEVGSCFGASIALEGDRLFVGAPCDSQIAENRGSVFVYRRVDGEWVFDTLLAPPADMGATWFGGFFAVDGDLIAVLSNVNSAELILHLFRRVDDEFALEAVIPFDRGALGVNSLVVDDDRVVVGQSGKCGAHSLLHVVAGENGFEVGPGLQPQLLLGAPLDETCDGGDDCHCHMGGGVGFHVDLIVTGPWRPQQATEHVLVFFEVVDGVSVHRGEWPLIGQEPIVTQLRSDGTSLAFGTYDGDAYVLTFGDVLGAPCTDDAACTHGFCRDGVCCDSTCGDGVVDDCLACSVAMGAPLDGVCALSTGNTCLDGDDDVCTVGTCTEGVCTTGPLACDDENPCTFDTCETDGCVHTNVDDGTPCVNGMCTDGKCAPVDAPNDGGAVVDGGDATNPSDCTCGGTSSSDAATHALSTLVLIGAYVRRKRVKRDGVAAR